MGARAGVSQRNRPVAEKDSVVKRVQSVIELRIGVGVRDGALAIVLLRTITAQLGDEGFGAFGAREDAGLCVMRAMSVPRDGDRPTVQCPCRRRYGSPARSPPK